MKDVELISSKKDVVCISVANRIDSVNSEHYHELLSKLRTENPQGRLEINCAALEYISSAGLRVLMKIAKDEASDHKIRITDVSTEVYEIFNVTGFTEIFEIRKAFRNISVDGCEIIGKGANGTVYRLDAETIVKVFNEEMPLDDIEKEREVSKQAFIKGIETAIAFDTVKVGNCYGVVFELLNSDSLSSTIKNDPEHFDGYAEKYVGMYKKLHSTTVDTDKIPSCKEKYLYYIDGCADWYTEEELNKLRYLINSIPDRCTLIHGDYHPHNIMVQNGNIVLIDMGDMSYGHPVFDFISTASTQANLLDLNPDFAEIHTGMPREMIRKLWYALLNRYFSDKMPEEIDRIDKQVRILSKLKVGMAPVIARGIPLELIKGSVEDTRQNLIPYIDSLVNTIDW